MSHKILQRRPQAKVDEHTLTYYCLTATMVIVLSKFRFLKEVGII